LGEATEGAPPNSRTGDKGPASPVTGGAVGTSEVGANGLFGGAILGRVLAVENDAADGRTF
jgi:hypothetical protein